MLQELVNQPITDKKQIDLLTEVHSLKQKVTATQREKDDLEDKLEWLQVDTLTLTLALPQPQPQP